MTDRDRFDEQFLDIIAELLLNPPVEDTAPDDSDELVEAKYIGSIKQTDLVRDIVANSIKGMGGVLYSRERHIHSTSKKRTYKQYKDVVYHRLLRLIYQYKGGRMPKTRFIAEVKTALREAYYKTFSLGIQSAGTTSLAGYPFKKEFVMAPEDKRWVNSALKHEGQYLNKFLQDIIQGTGRMPVEQRLGMYVETLDSVYGSGRVLGTPTTTLAYWVPTRNPGKHPICPSCRQLALWSPYFRTNIPTVPKAGMTICLTNCRCKLILKDATPQQMAKFATKQRSMVYMINRLLRIKQTRGKGIPSLGATWKRR